MKTPQSVDSTGEIRRTKKTIKMSENEATLLDRVSKHTGDTYGGTVGRLLEQEAKVLGV